jgi:hypothetical protein
MRARTTAAMAITVTVAACLVATTAGAKPRFGATYADCWFGKGKLTVKTKGSEQAVIRRQGRRIVVFGPQPARCRGGQATVRNTRTVNFILRGPGITDGIVTLDQGPFAPGRGPESDPSEIEFKITVPNESSEPVLKGTGGDDRWRAGERPESGPGLNLNSGDEPLTPDVDVEFGGRALASSGVRLEPRGGNDVVDLAGGPEFIAPLGMNTLARLGAGDDHFVGGIGTDLVLGGPGADVVATGTGDDLINVADGHADIIDCGPGHDFYLPDQLDIYVGCEEFGDVFDPH